MQCVIAVGLYRWCLVNIPEETQENKEALQRIRDEEFDQNLELELEPGVYHVEFMSEEDGDLDVYNSEYLLPILP